MLMRIKRYFFLAFNTAFVLVIFLRILIAQPILPVSLRPDAQKFGWFHLSRHVYAISDILSPRSWQQPKNLELVAGYIANEWRRDGIEVEEQKFETGQGEFSNVFMGAGPRTDDVIVIGAHYDAHGDTPGADDNASGVSGLIELGKALKKAELKTKVVLVAFSLEEPPHFGTEEMGSWFFARSLKASRKNVKAMISLEMIGYYSDEAGSQEFPSPLLRLFYPGEGNFIALTGNFPNIPLTRKVKRSMLSASNVPVYSINAPAFVPGIDFSDHRNFWSEGIPALMVTDTAFYRNKAYHTQNDKPERLDYKRMAEVMSGVHQAVLDLANE